LRTEVRGRPQILDLDWIYTVDTANYACRDFGNGTDVWKQNPQEKGGGK
jgi:hypothetical protein